MVTILCALLYYIHSHTLHWNQKGYVSQNYLFACNFDFEFIFCYTRGEGSATDTQVLEAGLKAGVEITDGSSANSTVLYRAHRCHRSIVNFNMLTALYRSLITLYRLLTNLCSTSQSAQFEIFNSMILLYLNLRQQKTTIKFKNLIWLFKILIQINYATCKISISGFESLVSKQSVERDQGANQK